MKKPKERYPGENEWRERYKALQEKIKNDPKYNNAEALSEDERKEYGEFLGKLTGKKKAGLAKRKA